MKWAEIPPGLSTNYLFSNSNDADFSDAEFSGAGTLVSRHHPELSDAESDDAEALNARHSLELIELESNDSRLKEVPKLDGDSRSISDASEDEEND
ncbi:hypothetical protein OXX69_008908 [Metschnikowia pulcherrima]